MAVKRTRTPPAASLMTSLRRSEAARPRPLNKAFRGRARQWEEWGGACGVGAAARARAAADHEVGGKDTLQRRRGREGAALQAGTLVRAGGGNMAARSARPGPSAPGFGAAPTPRLCSPLYLSYWNLVSPFVPSPSAVPFILLNSPSPNPRRGRNVRGGLFGDRSGPSGETDF